MNTENQTKDVRWYDKKGTIILLCILFFPVGLYGLWKNESISKGWKVGVTSLFAFIIIVEIAAIKKIKPSPNSDNATNSQITQEGNSKKITGIGDILHTRYFDITVNKAGTRDRINTGNEFANLKPENGIMYLFINATFKNIDNESRMLSEGSIWINYNGKDYEFDKSESIMADGWGLFLDQINPLTSKTTNLVYKIPIEIKGDVYWQPGRADTDQRIFIGKMDK